MKSKKYELEIKNEKNSLSQDLLLTAPKSAAIVLHKNWRQQTGVCRAETCRSRALHALNGYKTTATTAAVL